MKRILISPECVNPAYRPYQFAQQRYQIFFGGAASGKSAFLAARTVLDTLTGRNTLVVRKVGRTLRASCWNEILKAVSRMKLGAFFSVNRSENSITALSNGAQILFAGMDDPEKIKSVTPRNGPLTDIWIEEATECEYQDFKQLDKRLRGQTRHKKRMTLSLNPVWKTHWIYREFFTGWQDGASSLQTKDLCILKTTYRDNRYLTEDDRKALENEKDPYYRAVYTLGEWGVLGDVIYRSWRVAEPDGNALALPRRYGLDFGFASDPCACLCVAYDRKRKQVWVLDEMLEKGLTNAMLSQRLRDFVRPGGYVVCDSAEPKSIRELRELGIHALPAKKGPDSVIHGIQWLQGQTILVSPHCRQTANELTLYQWKRDTAGNALPIPEGGQDHLLDAMRYALEDESLRRSAVTSG